MAPKLKCPTEQCGHLMDDPIEYVTVGALDDLREEDGLLQWPSSGHRISGYVFRCLHCGTTVDVPLAAVPTLVVMEGRCRCGHPREFHDSHLGCSGSHHDSVRCMTYRPAVAPRQRRRSDG